MPLPEIVTPTYTLTVPSTKKKLKYRPFLVKEQKVLILALENKDQEQILDAVITVLKNCIITKTKIEDLSLFDLEFIFLQIRARSISEEIELKVTCADDGQTEVDVRFMVDDVNVHFPKGHERLIDLTDEIKVEMRYPDLEYFSTVNFGDATKIDPYELVGKCIKRVYVGEDANDDFTAEEAKEWVEKLTSEQFDKIQNFFNTMLTLRHEIKVKNPKTKVTNPVVIEGLADFFA